MSAQLLPDLVPEASVEVVILEWPAAETERRRLVEAEQPHVLVVEGGAAPPEIVDELEDWVRAPVPAVELAARCETLRLRARARAHAPRLEPGGVLRHGGRWVAVSPAQAPLVELLVDRLGQVVRSCELREAHVRAGGADDALAVAAVLRRIAPTVAEVGLDLHRLRDRGYLLERCDPVSGAKAFLVEPTPAERGGSRSGRLRPPARRSSLVGPPTATVRRATWSRIRAEDR